MAPKKRRNDNDESTAAVTTRVTRRSTRLASTTKAPPVSEPKPPKKKKAKTTTKQAVEAPPEEPETPAVEEGRKTVIIEHCKQCNSFKTRAIQVKNGLEKGVVGVNVMVNPEKPRRGCFEIREVGGGIFVSLLDMKRPFAPMKKLDMDKVISEIIDKING
ncbi:selenoprotein H [Forsythia ovata]|uniref:Selenoprotein H n=1 Tax=Forsythia ovata TaxID=205694 RepID=A0ABD1W270_9LAMI